MKFRPTDHQNKMAKSLIWLVLLFLLTNTSQYAAASKNSPELLPTKISLNLPQQVLPGMEEDQADYQSGELIIKLAAPVNLERSDLDNGLTGIKAIDELNRELGVYEMKALVDQKDRDTALDPLVGIYLLRFQGPGDLLSFIERYAALPGVVYAHPNYIYTANDLVIPDQSRVTPNDPYFADQWYLPHIDVPEAWDIEKGSADTVIAVVDTGVNYNHEDLVGKVILGYDYVNGDADPIDDQGHGTAMAGLIAANTNNSLGIAGICWDCKVLAIKSMGSDGTGTTWNVAQGITYAVTHGAEVINLSLGGPGSDSTMEDAISTAYAQNIVVVAAAGNENTDAYHYPAALPHVLSVAATDQTDGRLSSSNYGYWVNIAAPGYGLLTTSRGGGYENTCCTSGATAITSGIVGLVKDQNPSWSADQVMSRIACSADDISALNLGFEEFLGAGRVNAYRALTFTGPYSCGIKQVGYTLQSANNEVDIYPGNTFSLTMIAKTYLNNNVDVIASLSESDPYVSLNTNYVSFGTLKFGVRTGSTTPMSISISDDAPVGHEFPIDIVFSDAAYRTYNDSITLTVHPRLETGWPKTMNWGGDSSPTLADLNNDGELEILQTNVEGGLYIWQANGSNLPGWPKNDLGRADASAAAADLDRDGSSEVIIQSEGKEAIVYRADGSVMPGWPNTMKDIMCSSLWSSPAIGDVNGDGYLDVILGNYKGEVYVFNYKGKLLKGWPQKAYGAISGTPAVADLDSDGYLEIVVSSWGLGGTCGDTAVGGISIFNHDGTLLPGWPKTTPSTDSSPAIADLDNDGQLEIAVANYAFEVNSSIMPGFPVSGTGGNIHSAPAIADLDGDDHLDILFGDFNGMKLFAVKGDNGTALPGWPVSIPYRIFGGPIVVDLDGNGDLEVVVSTYGNHLYAWNHDGSLFPGFPLLMGGGDNWSTPAAGDIDADGRLELISNAGDTPKVFIWDMGVGSYNSGAMPWAQFHHDAWHTGLYGDQPTPSFGAIAINNFADSTNISNVTLTLSAQGAVEMMLASSADFTGAAWEPYITTHAWQLPEAEGTYTVYAKFRDATRTEYPAVHASIAIDLTPPIISIETPIEGVMLMAERYLSIYGSVVASDLDHYAVFYGEGAAPTTWTQIGNDHSAGITDSIIETWILDNIPTGPYTIKVSATDKAGNGSTATREVTLVRPAYQTGSIAPNQVIAGKDASFSLQVGNPFTDKSLTLTQGTKFWLLDGNKFHDVLLPPFSSDPGTHALGLDPNMRAIQTFVSPRTFMVSQISWLTAQMYPGIGTAIIEIRTLEDTGAPSSIVLFRETVAHSFPDWTPGIINAPDVNVWLQEGQGYAITLQSSSRNNASVFMNAPTLPEGKAYFDGGQGTSLSNLDGFEYKIFLFEPLSYKTNLSTNVTITAGGVNTLSFDSGTCPEDFTLGTYHPYLTYEGTMIGRPFKTFIRVEDHVNVLDPKIYRSYLPFIVR
jgi:thermitase